MTDTPTSWRRSRTGSRRAHIFVEHDQYAMCGRLRQVATDPVPESELTAHGQPLGGQTCAECLRWESRLR